MNADCKKIRNSNNKIVQLSRSRGCQKPSEHASSLSMFVDGAARVRLLITEP